eukprot:TRINITY_DN3304_c0_g1_i4.p1 TRINITY_DN3304_c0_g1~~TRINITY_DN3304_c0_g1_i4.p1  ORF type:complete len:459 (-),score=142.29 TRINITY_DN3304_c0_g1_i4:317-1693(-)
MKVMRLNTALLVLAAASLVAEGVHHKPAEHPKIPVVQEVGAKWPKDIWWKDQVAEEEAKAKAEAEEKAKAASAALAGKADPKPDEQKDDAEDNKDTKKKKKGKKNNEGPKLNTVKDWSKGSTLSEGVQFFLASAWISLLAAIPLILAAASDKPLTRTDKMLAGVLWVTLFGGLWLFTNIILFQSPHFQGKIRPLTQVECIYLMSQVITTVGYGDITPAKPRGQVFIGLYVLGALFVISMLVSQLIAKIGRVAQDYEKKLMEQSSEGVQRSNSSAALDKLHFIAGKPPAPDRRPLYKAMAIFAIVDVIFVTFFTLWPGEEKTLMQAFYMSVITLSTVGFGAFTPVTEGGMIFGAFIMLFGSAALLNVIGCFGELMVRQQKYEQFDVNTCEHALEHLEEKIQGTKVSELEFVKFALLSQALVSEEEIDKACAAFKHLSHDGSHVEINNIKSAMSKSLQAA